MKGYFSYIEEKALWESRLLFEVVRGSESLESADAVEKIPFGRLSATFLYTRPLQSILTDRWRG